MPVAVNVALRPLGVDAETGVTAILISAASVTVMLATGEVTPFNAAVTVVEPISTPVTTPVLVPTVAMAVLIETQAA